MKEKILIFIIGFLIGAIVATSGFLIYSKIVSNTSNQPEMMQSNPNEQVGDPQNGNGENPLEKPSGDNVEEPPEKPEDLFGDTTTNS